MGKPIRILVQTTISQKENDWTIDRFSLLREYLSSLTDSARDRLVEVTARNREENAAGDDAVLSQLDRLACYLALGQSFTEVRQFELLVGRHQ